MTDQEKIKEEILKDLVQVLATEKKEEKKDIWKILNNFSSIFSALVIGGLTIFLNYRTTQLESRIKEINTDLQTGQFIGGLMDALVSTELKKDIALIALNGTLVKRFDNKVSEHEAQEFQNISLIFDLTETILNEQLDLLENASEKNKITEPNTITKNTTVALEILNNIATKFNNHPEFEDFEEKYAQIEQRTFELLDSLAQKTTSSEIESTSTDKTKKTRTKEEINQGEIARDILRDVSRAKEKKGVVYLHYDQDSNKAQIQNFVAEKLEENWLVLENYVLVPQSAQNCSQRSSVRYFHQEDEQIAKEIQEIAKNHFENKQVFESKFDIIPLAQWTSKKNISVPEKQLELWIVSKNTSCTK